MGPEEAEPPRREDYGSNSTTKNTKKNIKKQFQTSPAAVAYLGVEHFMPPQLGNRAISIK